MLLHTIVLVMADCNLGNNVCTGTKCYQCNEDTVYHLISLPLQSLSLDAKSLLTESAFSSPKILGLSFFLSRKVSFALLLHLQTQQTLPYYSTKKLSAIE